MSQCDCRDCNCEEPELKVGDRVEVKYKFSSGNNGVGTVVDVYGGVVVVDYDDGRESHRSPHYAEYVTLLPKKNVAHRGEYDLDSIVGRVFYHDEDNVRLLLNRATTWIKRNDLTLVSIKFDNDFDGGRYSESVTVIGERP